MSLFAFRSCSGLQRPSASHGIALVAVLWMTAALAILVAGMSFAVRVDTRLASDHAESARARALLDGGLRLAAAELVSMGRGTTAPTSFVYRIGDVEVQTAVVRASGFVSINDAPESLLVDLFRYGAQLPDEQAVMLAQRIIDWRDPDDEPQPYGAERDQYLAAGASILPRNEPFRHPEDLGQVLGMDPAVHDKIAGLITVTKGGAGAVNPLLAPADVLGVLARGNDAAVQGLLGARQTAEGTGFSSGIDLSAMEQRHVAEWYANDYRLQAHLELPGGVVWTRVAWLSAKPSAGSGRGGQPWEWLYAESPQRGKGKNGETP